MRWQELTLREKIGQTVILLMTPEDFLRKCGSEAEFIRRYPVGGFFRCGALEIGKMVTYPDFRSVIEPYRAASRVPFFLLDDLEHGASDNNMKDLPYLLALGAADDEKLARDYGRVMGMEARRAGLNWICAPVCDAAATKNPLNDARDIHGDHAHAVRLLKKVHEGIKSEGILPTVKHFPSGGLDKDDYHLGPVQLDVSADEWMAKVGNLYKEMIANGAQMIMTTHASLPCMQSEAENDGHGNYAIATVSKELTTGLLKEKLGFNGVVVSDGLLMGGFADQYAPEKMVDCFMAGTDLLMWPPFEYIDLMEQLILDRKVPMERLDDAVSRIWKLKMDMGLFKKDIPEDDYDDGFACEVTKTVAVSCITLVNNFSNRIPFDPRSLKKILVVAVAPNDEDAEKLREATRAFERRGISADFKRDVWMSELTPEIQEEYQMILFAICRLPHHPAGPLDVFGNNAYSVWTSHICDPGKMVAVSFGSPWTYKYYRADDMYINAYSPTPEIIDAVVAGLVGEIPFKGKTPVDLKLV